MKPYLLIYSDGIAAQREFKTLKAAEEFLELLHRPGRNFKVKTYTLFKVGSLASPVHIRLGSDHYTVLDTNEPYYQKNVKNP